MNAITSYLRHFFVTGIIMLMEKYRLPVEGAEDAANAVALFLVMILSWLFAKYIAPHLKPSKSAVKLLIVLCMLVFLLPSCATAPGSRPPVSPEAVQVGADLLKIILSSGK